MKLPLQPQSERAGQAVRIMPATPLFVVVVTFRPGIPETGKLLPEFTVVNDGPKSVHVTEPSCGIPVASLTVCIPTETGLLADKATITPPAGAVPVRVAVPLRAVPPVTVLGSRDIADSTAGLIVRAALRVPL